MSFKKPLCNSALHNLYDELNKNNPMYVQENP